MGLTCLFLFPSSSADGHMLPVFPSRAEVLWIQVFLFQTTQVLGVCSDAILQYYIFPHEIKHVVCLKQRFEKLNLGRPQYGFAHRYYSSACCAGAFARILVNKMGPQGSCLKSMTPFSRNQQVQMQVQMQVHQAQLKSPSRLIKHAVHLFQMWLRGFVSASV